MAKIGRIRRAFQRLQSLSLDGKTRWPSFITIVSEDERGPLVISIANATVFPDGSVRAGGRWIRSEGFGIGPNFWTATEVRVLDGEFGFVTGRNRSVLDAVASLGPRLVTLGTSKPGLGVFVNSGHYPIESVVDDCGLRLSDVLIPEGSARRVDVAVFARIAQVGPTNDFARQFVEQFLTSDETTSGEVYLMHSRTPGEPFVSPEMVNSRIAHEISGSALLVVTRTPLKKIARTIAAAQVVTLETPLLEPLTAFARATTTVRVANHSVTPHRDPRRFTQSGIFDIDSALIKGDRLPRGVEVISRPDSAVVETTTEDHRVFSRGRWRPQDPEVLVEQTIGQWLISVSNAVVAPNGSVYLDDGTLLAGPYFGTPSYNFTTDGLLMSEVSGRAGLALTRYSAFGHVLLQVAPRVAVLSKFDNSMKILAGQVGWDDTEILRHCGSTPERIFRVVSGRNQHLVRVPELIVATHMQPEVRTARADPRTLNEFVAQFATRPTPNTSRKVYLARNSDSGKRGGCANREELTALAEEFGYETVYPEHMSLDAQIELASSTTEMLGEQGSALTWSMFMPRGSRLVLVQNPPRLREDRDMTYQNSILAARGSSLFEVKAVRAGTPRNYEIDPATVRRALEKLP